MDNNTKILYLIQERLNKGAKQYGDFVPIDGSRDNLKEALDEVLDLCVYLSAVVLELHQVYEKEVKEKERKEKGIPF
tara:strand:+ start:3677 stop:3907 length:231 start_codon:yes stop_codon:yes gene_type:complete